MNNGFVRCGDMARRQSKQRMAAVELWATSTSVQHVEGNEHSAKLQFGNVIRAL